MKKIHVQTGLFAFAFICLFLYFSDLPWVLYGTTALICCCSLLEICGALSVRHKSAVLIGGAAELAILLLIPESAYCIVLTVFCIIMMILYGTLMFRIYTTKEISGTAKVLIISSIPMFFSGMPLIRNLPNGESFLPLAVFICMTTDGLCYFCGTRLGAHKLAPQISSSKTLEGSICGTVLTALLFGSIMYLAGTAQPIFDSMTIFAVYLISSSVVAQIGDLCMSAVRKLAKIRHFRNFFSCHGGMLDRFDGLMLVIPYTYLFCIFFDNSL